MLQQLIYTSQRKDDTDRFGYSPQFLEIGTIASDRNKHFGITGFLICTPSWYCQFLEGKEKALDELMRSIEKDRRHFDLKVIKRTPIETNSFPNWGMSWAHKTESNAELFSHRGFSDQQPPQLKQMTMLADLTKILVAKNQSEIKAAP